MKPWAATWGSASYQSGRRVQGSANTAPMATLIEAIDIKRKVYFQK